MTKSFIQKPLYKHHPTKGSIRTAIENSKDVQTGGAGKPPVTAFAVIIELLRKGCIVNGFEKRKKKLRRSVTRIIFKAEETANGVVSQEPRTVIEKSLSLDDVDVSTSVTPASDDDDDDDGGEGPSKPSGASARRAGDQTDMDVDSDEEVRSGTALRAKRQSMLKAMQTAAAAPPPKKQKRKRGDKEDG